VAQSNFPSADALLEDEKHKEPKSGLSMQGGNLIIRSGVGTPATVNQVSFSQDGSFLAVAKDFGRVVIFAIKPRTVLRVIETGQGVVHSVSLSPDKTLIATAGNEDKGGISIWKLGNGKRIKSVYVGHPDVQFLTFLSNDRLLVKENDQSIYVLDVTTGQKIVEISEEYYPIVSSDGKLLMTASKDAFVLRSTSDFKVLRTLPRPSKYLLPAALSSSRDMYVAEDPFDKRGFVVAKLSDGSPLPYRSLGKELEANPSAGFFVSIDEHSGVVFGHSQARIWAWQPETGKVCASDVLYSEAGALSPDGTVVVSGVNNGFLSGKNDPTGVRIWDTTKVLKSCGMESAHLQ
jgi:WD40 repeat protein